MKPQSKHTEVKLMSIAEANVTEPKRPSSIWIIPILALVVGVWLVIKSYQDQGPLVTITFETASGVAAEKTKIKLRDVEIGIVESVELSENYERVHIEARIEKSAEDLLTEDAQFWVVKPRIGKQGISGVGTLLSGSYIVLSPGDGASGHRDYTGLENPPLTAPDIAGLHVILKSEKGGSLSAGDPVLYRDFAVGQIERAYFNVEDQLFEYSAFIQAPYDDLLTSTSRFWEVSGFSIDTDANGISLKAGSVESILMGGVSFGIPADVSPGQPVDDGTQFTLHPSIESIDKQPYRYYLEFVLLFQSSVRGLKEGAPVQYRGIQMGTVTGVSFSYIPESELISSNEIPIPVRIRIDPGRIGWPDTQDAMNRLGEDMKHRVEAGLRASLKTGSLLTGNLFVSLDFYDDAEPVEIHTLGEYSIFPTISTGLNQIERQVSNILDKIEKLPLEQTVDSANVTIVKLSEALTSAKSTLDSLTQFVANEDTQSIPSEISEALAELRITLNSFSAESEFQRSAIDALEEIEEVANGLEDVLKTLNAKPNALIFSGNPQEDPEPGRIAE